MSAPRELLEELLPIALCWHKKARSFKRAVKLPPKVVVVSYIPLRSSAGTFAR